MNGLLYAPLLQTSTGGDDLSTFSLVSLGVLSLLIGLMGGLVGIALGIIRLPLMTLMGIDPLIAAGTNLLVSAVSSIAGSWPAILQNRVAFRVVLALGVPAFIGSLIGGRYADIAPVWLLLIIVALFLVWSSLSLIIQATNELRLDQAARKNTYVINKGELTKKTVVREGVVGIVIGMIGSAVGLALGVLRMPALVQVLKMDPGTAAGTNLIITVIVSLSGFAGHLLEGRIDWTLVWVVGGPSTVGMYVGSRLTTRFEPAKLRLIIGVVLLLVAPVMFYDAVTR